VVHTGCTVRRQRNSSNPISDKAELLKSVCFYLAANHSYQQLIKFVFQKMIEPEVLNAYRSVFAQTFSRNGTTLYIGDNLGKITIYNVNRWAKTQEFQTQLESIQLIVEYKNILIAGGIGGLVTLLVSEDGTISKGKRITSESYNTALVLEEHDVLIGGGPRGILYTIDLNVFHIIKEDTDSHKGNQKWQDRQR